MNHQAPAERQMAQWDMLQKWARGSIAYPDGTVSRLGPNMPAKLRLPTPRLRSELIVVDPATFDPREITRHPDEGDEVRRRRLGPRLDDPLSADPAKQDEVEKLLADVEDRLDRLLKHYDCFGEADPWYALTKALAFEVFPSSDLHASSNRARTVREKISVLAVYCLAAPKDIEATFRNGDDIVRHVERAGWLRVALRLALLFRTELEFEPPRIRKFLPKGISEKAYRTAYWVLQDKRLVGPPPGDDVLLPATIVHGELPGDRAWVSKHPLPLLVETANGPREMCANGGFVERVTNGFLGYPDSKLERTRSLAASHARGWASQKSFIEALRDRDHSWARQSQAGGENRSSGREPKRKTSGSYEMAWSPGRNVALKVMKYLACEESQLPIPEQDFLRHLEIRIFDFSLRAARRLDSRLQAVTPTL
jgi:hypothetical protein